MDTIVNLQQIKSLSGKVYVRWSRSLTLDAQRGYSLRSGTSAEAGLSCCEIDKSWPDWRILRQLTEYQFCGGHCWLITGDKIDVGADNEPLLINIQPLAKVNSTLIKANWRRMELAEQVALDEARLARITDPIGYKITSQALDKERQELDAEIAKDAISAAATVLGHRTSKRKAISSAANGRKGGRPRKITE